MRKIGEGRLKIMDNFGSFGGFQGTNYESKSGVFCQNLTLALGGRYCGKRIQRLVRRRGRGL